MSINQKKNESNAHAIGNHIGKLTNFNVFLRNVFIIIVYQWDEL